MTAKHPSGISWEKRHPEYYVEYRREWEQKNKEYRNKQAKAWREANKEKVRAIEWRKKEKVKRAVFEAYGNKCACCGESTYEFLGIDHIYGNGVKHRKEVGVGYKFYRWLRDHDYPKDEFRLLCHNCNLSLGHHGYCPHGNVKKELRVVA